MTECTDIVGYEGLYQVSDSGRVKSLKRKKFLKQQITPKGYARVHLSKNGVLKKHLAHRLVLKAFKGENREKPLCNHIDCNKQNNTLSNLEWCTDSENKKHASAHGLTHRPVGSKNGRALLSEFQVKRIKLIKLITSKITYKKIAKMLNVKKHVVSRIFQNKTWKHVTI